MTEISAFSNRKSGFNENHSSENNNCTNNNCSITVYFCEDLPVTTKALAREIVKKSQIQQTSGKGIHEPVTRSNPIAGLSLVDFLGSRIPVQVKIYQAKT